jgi:hypothetical protein
MKVISEWGNRTYLEGSGRGLILRYYLDIGQERHEMYETLRIAGFRAEIWTRSLPNTKESVDHSTTIFRLLPQHVRLLLVSGVKCLKKETNTTINLWGLRVSEVGLERGTLQDEAGMLTTIKWRSVDVTECDSKIVRDFGFQRRRIWRWLSGFCALMMEAVCPSETSINYESTWQTAFQYYAWKLCVIRVSWAYIIYLRFI